MGGQRRGGLRCGAGPGAAPRATQSRSLLGSPRPAPSVLGDGLRRDHLQDRPAAAEPRFLGTTTGCWDTGVRNGGTRNRLVYVGVAVPGVGCDEEMWQKETVSWDVTAFWLTGFPALIGNLVYRCAGDLLISIGNPPYIFLQNRKIWVFKFLTKKKKVLKFEVFCRVFLM